MKRTLTFVMLVPRNLCVVILRFYRAVISPLYGDVCRYYPTCSGYALTAIQHYGVVKGVWAGSRRLVRCHPWAEGGIDDVAAPHQEKYLITPFGFVTQPQLHRAAATLVSSHGKG